MPLDGAFNAVHVTAARNKNQVEHLSVVCDAMHRYVDTGVQSTKVRLSFSPVLLRLLIQHDDSLLFIGLNGYPLAHF